MYESLNEKELRFIHEKMQNAMEDFNAVLNIVQDGNQKKAMSSLMNKTIDTFNEKIKGVEYHPDNQSLEDQIKMSNEIDGKLREEENSSDETSLANAQNQENLA